MAKEVEQKEEEKKVEFEDVGGPDVSDDGGFTEDDLTAMDSFGEEEEKETEEKVVDGGTSTEETVAVKEPEPEPEPVVGEEKEEEPVKKEEVKEDELADAVPPVESKNVVDAARLLAAQEKVARELAVVKATPSTEAATLPSQTIPQVPIPTTPAVPETPAAQQPDFITEENFQKLFESPQVLNDVLRQRDAQTKQSLLQELIPAVLQMVQQQNTLLEARRDFYSVNPDLAKFQTYMGQLGEVLSAQHPDWDIPTLFTAAEKEAREQLNLPKSVETIAPEKPKPARKQIAGARPSRKPATAPKGARRTPTTNPRTEDTGDLSAEEFEELVGLKL